MPQANDEGLHEFNFADGTTVWWLTRAGGTHRLEPSREVVCELLEVQVQADVALQLAGNKVQGVLAALNGAVGKVRGGVIGSIHEDLGGSGHAIS